MSSSNVPATRDGGQLAVQAPQVDPAILDTVIGTGDLNALQPRERVNMYLALCDSVGLNPLSRPFEYIKIQGKTTLYFKATGAEQLRVIHGVQVHIIGREMLDGMYIVTATAGLPNGRTDEAQGIVVVEGLKKTDKANAMMKCETKAKRRVTLSLLGMSFLEDVYAKPLNADRGIVVHVDQATGEITNQASIDAKEERDDALPASMVNGRRSRGLYTTEALPPMDEPGTGEPLFTTPPVTKPDVGWATWSENMRKSFWAKANELNLSNEGVYQEFGVESMKDYAESQDTARMILAILDYGINKVTVGLQGIWAALGVKAVYKWLSDLDDAKAAIDNWALEQDTAPKKQGELAMDDAEHARQEEQAIMGSGV